MPTASGVTAMRIGDARRAATSRTSPPASGVPTSPSAPRTEKPSNAEPIYSRTSAGEGSGCGVSLRFTNISSASDASRTSLASARSSTPTGACGPVSARISPSKRSAACATSSAWRTACARSGLPANRSAGTMMPLALAAAIASVRARADGASASPLVGAETSARSGAWPRSSSYSSTSHGARRSHHAKEEVIAVSPADARARTCGRDRSGAPLMKRASGCRSRTAEISPISVSGGMRSAPSSRKPVTPALRRAESRSTSTGRSSAAASGVRSRARASPVACAGWRGSTGPPPALARRIANASGWLASSG